MISTPGPRQVYRIKGERPGEVRAQDVQSGRTAHLGNMSIFPTSEWKAGDEMQFPRYVADFAVAGGLKRF